MIPSLPESVRIKSPLVYAITNFVTMDWVARGLLAAGARPVMARDQTEAAALGRTADALLLNLGTLTAEALEAMFAAGAAAAKRSIPIVLDPVGAGGLDNRTEAALRLLESLPIAAVRANAGEIAALAGQAGLVRGVDSRAVALRDTARAARWLADRYSCVVAATGAVDIVTNGTRTLAVRGGSPLMAQIPGAGCLASALVAAALASRDATAAASWEGAPAVSREGAPDDIPAASGPDPLDMVAGALLWTGLAAEEAAGQCRGPGSFAPALLDGLAVPRSLPDGRIAPPLEERLSLYVIVNGSPAPGLVREVLAAGTGAVQFREKRLPLPLQIDAARQIQAACRAAGALFLVNDRVDLALAVGADGVHLGQDDLPVAEARRLLGPGAIIGATCETPAEARAAADQGADYIGTGPVYATPSKPDAGEPYGPDVVKRISAAVALPVVGIGGIGIGGAAPVIEAGGSGVAVISSVMGSQNPGAAARAILAEVMNAKRRRFD